ncbi:hypothetical protein AAY473_015205, partial [Plecturocebus cupreus]
MDKTIKMPRSHRKKTENTQNQKVSPSTEDSSSSSVMEQGLMENECEESSELGFRRVHLLKREKLTIKQLQAGPPGGILEEGIVITGDDSSMRVTAPEELPVGRDVEVEDSGIDDPGPMLAEAN